MRVDERLFRFDDGAGLALVVDAEDLVADFKLAAGGGYGDGLEECDGALAVDDAAGVELGDAGDGDGVGAGVEVDDVEVGFLEGEDDAVGGEDLEVGVEFLGSDVS